MPEKEGLQKQPKRKGIFEAIYSGLSEGIGTLLSIPGQVVISAGELLTDINRSTIKEWVAENVKTLKDWYILGKATFLPTEKNIKEVITHFQQRELERREKEEKEKKTALPLSTAEIDLTKVKASPTISTFTMATSASTVPVITDKQESIQATAQEEKIETMQKVREEFDKLVRRGLFVNNSEQAFHLLNPLLQVMVTSPNRKIPSWFVFANWQINYLDESVDLLRFAQAYSQELQKAGIYLDVGDVLAGIYARTFDDIYTLSKHGILDFILPEPSLDSIKDPHQRYLTERWIESVYRGYKLMKKEPPPEIKILYNSLSKGTSAKATIDTRIYSISQEIRRATGEVPPDLIEEEEEVYEPETTTIQTQFLRRF
jgi:hypothetical protein